MASAAFWWRDYVKHWPRLQCSPQGGGACHWWTGPGWPHYHRRPAISTARAASSGDLTECGSAEEALLAGDRWGRRLTLVPSFCPFRSRPRPVRQSVRARYTRRAWRQFVNPLTVPIPRDWIASQFCYAPSRRGRLVSDPNEKLRQRTISICAVRLNLSGRDCLDAQGVDVGVH